MKRIDSNVIPDNKEEVRLFMVGVDVGSIIEKILDHYFSIGIGRVFFIDNNSRDETVRIISNYKNIHIWNQDENYGPSNKYGVLWIEQLLGIYGVGQWVLLADTDELFIYPNYEKVDISSFVSEIYSNGYDLVPARFIDMYGKGRSQYIGKEDSILDKLCYFDLSEFGFRNRIFGFKPSYLKHPLFKYERGLDISAGFHFVKGNSGETFSYTCGILHLKSAYNFKNAFNAHKNKMPDSDVKNSLYEKMYEMSMFNKLYSKKWTSSKDLDLFQKYKFDSIRFKKLKKVDRLLSRYSFTKWLVKYSNVIFP